MRIKKKISFLIATFLGLGYSPKAPGTVGSLATLPIAYVLSLYGNWQVLLAVILGIYVVGVLSTREVLKYTSHDPSFVVIDEVVGQLLSFISITKLFPLNNVCWLLGGFVAFRFFDILKPWPVSYFDKKWKNASGVMMDDVAAGIYAACILKIIHLFL